MTRTPFPGGLFVDAWPTGEFVVLFPGSHLDTHLGRVNFPHGETYGPLFLASTRNGGFTFCGLAHDANGTMLQWDQTHGWVPGPPYVTGRGVYDARGVWRDTLPAGYQFLNDAGVPITRIDTYGPKFGLSEWVETDGLYIGQGHESGGIQIWDGTDHRTLDTGLCYFLRVHRVGELVTVSYAKSGTGAVIVQTTLSELRALPIADDGTPSPEKEPDPMILPNHLGALTRLRAEYPAKINAVQAVELLNKLAWQFKDEGFGLLAKPNGNHGPQPRTGIFTSCDWLTNKNGLGFDALRDGPDNTTGELGEAEPTWGEGEPYDVTRFVAPVKPIGADAPDDDEGEPDEQEPTGDWQAAVAALTKRVTALEKRPAGTAVSSLRVTEITLKVEP